MYVSLHVSPQSRGAVEDAAIIDMAIRQIVESDAAGIASVSITEHHLGGFNTFCNPFMFGANVAPLLKQTYLVIAVACVPVEHPVRLVELSNMLDTFTKGRCLIALAPGSVRQIELDAFGVPFEERRERLNQGMESMLKAWGWRDGDGALDVSNDFYKGTIAGRVSPSSYRLPHPLLARATASDPTVIEAAEAGWPVMLFLDSDPSEEQRAQVALYRERLNATGHSDEVIRECEAWMGPFTAISLASTIEEAERYMRDYIELGGAGPIVTEANEGTPEWAAAWRDRQADRAKFTRCFTPETLIEHLRYSCETLDINHVRLALLEMPGDEQRSMEMFHLLLEEVLPHLDPEPLPGPHRTVVDDDAVPSPA